MIMELRNISFAYPGGSNVLSNISFSVDRGQIISILGPNGVGKTTLLSCMGNLVPPTGGEILIEGKSLGSMSPKEVGRNIGFVPQFIIPSFAYEVLDYVVTGCSVFPYAQDMIGMPAEKVAEWVLNGEEDAKRGIGMAVITAASRCQDLKDVESPGLSFGVNVNPEDRVGMIGYIHPIAMEFKKKAGDVIIFDMGISLRGGNGGQVYPMEDQPKLLRNSL